MFDSKSEPKDESAFLEELEQSAFGDYDDYYEAEPPRNFLGMSSGQRFVIALMLLGTVVVVGLLCLLVTEKVLIF
jgi:hypothetical protein